MRPPRKLAFGMPALVVGIAAVVIGTGATAHAATAVHYVALGDSYSSGLGSGDTSGSCDQSPNAYAELWNSANAPASFTFEACAGATVPTVISSQLSGLSSSTTLVSITIGGNDANFSSTMETCVLESTSSCESAVSKDESFVENTLPGEVSTLLADIHGDAPNAKVIVLDYPEFYDTSVSGCIGLSGGDHQAIDTGINDLDSVLATAAANHGDTFTDVRSAFAGHELCDSSEWLNSITLPVEASYHPTAAGQKDGFLPAFSAAAAKAGQ